MFLSSRIALTIAACFASTVWLSDTTALALTPVSFLQRNGMKFLPQKSTYLTNRQFSFKSLLLATKKENTPQDFTNLAKPIRSWVMTTAFIIGTYHNFFVSPAVAFDPSIFSNDYVDQLHPQCRRRIEVQADGKSFRFSGTSVNQPEDDPIFAHTLRGCSKAEIQQFGLQKVFFDGALSENGEKISAGEGIHEGVWEPAGSTTTNLEYSNVDGIRWNDENKWIVKTKSFAVKMGEAIMYSYIGFSLLAGIIGLNKMYLNTSQKNERNM